MNPAVRPRHPRRIDFPVELFACSIRQDARRLFLPLMCVLSLLFTVFLLWGVAEATRPFRRTGTGLNLLPVVAGTVFAEMLVFLGLNVPFGLRVATADDDLPLVMLTGLSPRGLWRARVSTAAVPALAIPLAHTPLLAFIYTLGGIRGPDFGSVIVFWFAGWLLCTGWAALAGSIWTGAGRDRMQGLALTFLFAFFHALGLAIIVRCLSWLNSPWTWWVLQSLQAPWNWTGPEFARLGAHVLMGCLYAWSSVIILRGRWRTSVEIGSKESEPAAALPSHAVMKSTGSDELPVVARPWRGAWSPPRPRCGSDPWFWKDFHVSGGSWWYWWGRMATAVALTLLALFFCSRSISGRYVEPVIVLTMIGWFVWMMFEVGQVLTVEFQDRMWSTVRITPNSVATILAHKMRAFALKLAPSFLPLGVVLAFGLTTYAHLVVLVGLPVLLMASFPFAALILYGSAIPQTLIGGGWRMVRTLAPVGMVIFLAGFVCTCSDAIPFDVRAVVLWSMFLVMSIGVTTWIYFSTLWELNDPSRERLSSDGG